MDEAKRTYEAYKAKHPKSPEQQKRIDDMRARMKAKPGYQEPKYKWPAGSKCIDSQMCGKVVPRDMVWRTRGTYYEYVYLCDTTTLAASMLATDEETIPASIEDTSSPYMLVMVSASTFLLGGALYLKQKKKDDNSHIAMTN